MSILENQDISRKEISVSEDQVIPIAGFEKLWVWQKSHKLMLDIHHLCRNLPYEERFRIRNQIERSSSSVPDNIAEGHTSYYFMDKIKGFNVARKEAGETQNHLRSLQGKGYISNMKANHLIFNYEEVIKGINGYINWVRRKRDSRKT